MYLARTTTAATDGSLYITGFAQAGLPHAGLIIARREGTYGKHLHIHTKQGDWAQEFKSFSIESSMSLTTLLKIHDVSAGAITEDQLENAGKVIAVPEGSDGGQCLPWVIEVVKQLHADGLVNLTSASGLADEFVTFATGNRAFARKGKYPNCSTSINCS